MNSLTEVGTRLWTADYAGTATDAHKAAGREVLGADKSFASVREWARHYNGVLPVPNMMASPPTASFSTAPTLGGTSPNVSHSWTNSVFVYPGQVMVDNGSGLGVGSISSKSDGSKVAGGVTRMRFMTDEPEVEWVTGFSQRVVLNVQIDGETAYSENPVNLPQTSGTRYTKFSFGANVVSYRIIQAMGTINAGGSGYTVGDVLTASGGTGTAFTVTVTAVSSGAVTEFMMKTGGSYTAIPSSPISFTGGTGTGATLTPIWGSTNSTRKMRRWEISWTGDARIRGINIPSTGKILPWPAPDKEPSLVILGDSQQAGTYLITATGHMGLRMGHRLGLYAKMSLNAQGGTGWNTVNGTSPKWSDPLRVADIIAQAPDMLLIIGSQNDVDNAATGTAVTTALDQITAALPNTLIVGLGSALCTGSTNTKAGFLAAQNQSRIRYIDNVAQGWINGTGKITGENGTGNRDFFISGDGTLHLTQDGTNLWADVAAPQIAAAFVDMAESL